MAEVKKILIIRLSSFGDVVLTFPLINLIKNKIPGAHISFVVKEKYAGLVELNPNVDEVIKLTDTNQDEIKKIITSSGYDIVIDLQNNPRSRLMIAGMNNIYQFKKNNFKKFLLVKFKINKMQDSEPVYKRYIKTVEEPFGISESEMGFTSSQLNYVKKNIDHDYIVIAPSSRHFTKTYPKEKFVEYILSKSNDKFVLVGDSSDTDTNICSYIKEHTSNTENLCGQLSYGELAGVIAESKFVICNDSGILHLAEALGKKVVSIFGNTVKEFGFFPQLEGSVVNEVQGLKCRPCSHIGLPECPLGHFKCMMENKID